MTPRQIWFRCALITGLLAAGCENAGLSELEYLREMIPHHREAVAFSQNMLTIGVDAELQSLLEEIILIQTLEIGQMQTWLHSWYPDNQGEGSYAPMMRSVDNLSPAEARVVFLQDMIRHHEHAVEQSQALLGSEAPLQAEVRTLATNIISSQMEEIALMRAWLGPDAPAESPHVGH